MKNTENKIEAEIINNNTIIKEQRKVQHKDIFDIYTKSIKNMNNKLIDLNKFQYLSSNFIKSNAKNNNNKFYSNLKNVLPAAVGIAATTAVVVSAATSSTTSSSSSLESSNTPSAVLTSSPPPATNTSNDPSQDPNYYLIEFIAGALGGVVSRTATAPIDRLRTFLQVYSVEQKSGTLNYRKIFHHMIQEGNYISLWRGNLVNVLKTAPENAVKLVTYEKLKKFLQSHNAAKSNSVNEKFICGSVAGFVAQLMLFPLKTVKVVMNLRNTGEYKSIMDCVIKMYNKNGMKSFYRGLLANSVAIMPASGIDLAAYETFKIKYSQFRNKSEPNVIERLVLGNLSSALGNFVVYPLIFVRTRLQSNRNINETTVNLLLHVWKKDGISGLYRGFGLHVLKIGPAASLSYITFEYVNKLFNINSLV